MKFLLGAGVAVPFIYFANLIVGGWLAPGFDHASQMPSELGVAGVPYAAAFALIIAINAVTIVVDGAMAAANVGLLVRGLALVAFSSTAYLCSVVMRRV